MTNRVSFFCTDGEVPARQSVLLRARTDVRRHADADGCVGVAYRYVLARFYLACVSRFFVQRFVGGFDGGVATVEPYFASADAQIEQRILQLRRVREARPQDAGADNFQVQGRNYGAAGQVHHHLDQLADIGRVPIDRLLPRDKEVSAT
jgi:hypothetical protein